jgi:predicted CoA-binding protein
MTSSTVSDSTLKQLLTDLHTIAVVGISTNPGKDSHMVAAYLKKHGYRIIPVNPGADEVLGEKSYPDLRSIPEPVDIVDVFRRPEFLPEIAEQAVAIQAKVLWMQKGISNEEAARIAKQGGLTVIEDT